MCKWKKVFKWFLETQRCSNSTTCENKNISMKNTKNFKNLSHLLHILNLRISRSMVKKHSHPNLYDCSIVILHIFLYIQATTDSNYSCICSCYCCCFCFCYFAAAAAATLLLTDIHYYLYTLLSRFNTHSSIFTHYKQYLFSFSFSFMQVFNEVAYRII